LFLNFFKFNLFFPIPTVGLNPTIERRHDSLEPETSMPRQVQAVGKSRASRLQRGPHDRQEPSAPPITARPLQAQPTTAPASPLQYPTPEPRYLESWSSSLNRNGKFLNLLLLLLFIIYYLFIFIFIIYLLFFI
jgi:hypothetical protein